MRLRGRCPCSWCWFHCHDGVSVIKDFRCGTDDDRRESCDNGHLKQKRQSPCRTILSIHTTENRRLHMLYYQ